MEKRNITATLFVLVLFSLFVMGCGNTPPISSDQTAVTPEPVKTPTPTIVEKENLTETAGGSSEITGNDNANTLSGAKGGRLYISTVPSMANVYVGGERKGTTPHILAGVTPGTYSLSITKNGYANYTGTAEVVEAKTTKLKIELTPLGSTA